MTAKGPLSGITIVDLTRVLAGPFCTLVLADLGARVIKVEEPGCGDEARRFGPYMGDRSAYFMSINRGKEGIALDLKVEEDRGVFERLLERADVLVENYRPGTMDRLGLGWETLHQRHPRLIYAAVSGFGRTGPYSHRPAYDIIAQAMGGLMSLTGYPDGPPARVGTSIGDITAALFLAVGINASLYYREHSGEGMLIDVAMLDGQVAILENAIARYLTSGAVPRPLGTRHPAIAPFEALAAADGHLVIAAANDSLFARLCAALGRDDLPENPLFRTNDLRAQHREALKDELESVLGGRPVKEWLKTLEDAGVPSGPINTVDKVLADPQVIYRNMAVSMEDPVAGPLIVAGNPIKISVFPDPTTRAPAPELDGDRDRILAMLEE
ncbi:MAG TPA: CoA transferase [Thermoleophilia bacterium]|nr:CoA transferase [Thermoleophilia bacterium]